MYHVSKLMTLTCILLVFMVIQELINNVIHYRRYFFSLFINDLASDINSQRCGVKVGIDAINIRRRHSATFGIYIIYLKNLNNQCIVCVCCVNIYVYCLTNIEVLKFVIIFLLNLMIEPYRLLIKAKYNENKNFNYDNFTHLFKTCKAIQLYYMEVLVIMYLKMQSNLTQSHAFLFRSKYTQIHKKHPSERLCKSDYVKMKFILF